MGGIESVAGRFAVESEAPPKMADMAVARYLDGLVRPSDAVAERFLVAAEDEGESPPQWKVPKKAPKPGRKPKEIEGEWKVLRPLVMKEDAAAAKLVDRLLEIYAELQPFYDQLDKNADKVKEFKAKKIEPKIKEQREVLDALAKVLDFKRDALAETRFALMRYVDMIFALFRKVKEVKDEPDKMEIMERKIEILKKKHPKIEAELEKEVQKWKKKETKDLPDLVEDAFVLIKMPKKEMEKMAADDAGIKARAKKMFKAIVSKMKGLWESGKESMSRAKHISTMVSRLEAAIK